jgi:hypothetical protein
MFIFDPTNKKIMTTVQKMRLIQKLMDEVEIATRVVAKEIEDIDTPLYRMLTEGCADQFKVMSKNYNSLSSGFPIDSWEKQLNHAYKLISEKK